MRAVLWFGVWGACGTDEPTEPGSRASGPEARTTLVCGGGRGEHGSLQAAIDAAAPGDTLEVCGGTWGPIALRPAQKLRIVSTEGPEATTIDGGRGTAVSVHVAELELRGFRLTGTGADEPYELDRGGAMTIEEGVVTLADAVVEGVRGDFGVVFDENLLVMEDVVWRDNSARILWFLFEGLDATVRRNTVLGGVHEGVLTGGELYRLELSRNVFSGVTIDAGFSAFLFDSIRRGPMVVENNVFYGFEDLGAHGGRMFEGEVDFRNNIVQGNNASDLVPFQASYSVFWDNGGDYRGVVRGEGNLFVDPRMVDPAGGDFHLAPGSPAIDAGDPDPAYDDPDGTRNDIGRYAGE